MLGDALAPRARSLCCLALCALFALWPQACGLAAKATPQPGPTAIPQPTLHPNAEPYDELRPELLTQDMLIATSAILVETTTGTPVFEKSADQVMFPASTTKIMTALLAIQFGDLSETTTISYNATNLPEDASKIPLSEGEVVNVRDLLYAMMMRSGNDGAIALAEYVSGSVEEFVDLMNRTAAFLGCTNTHFANPHGYMDENHYTTARDMAIIARAAMEIPQFRELAATYEYTMPASNTHPVRKLVSNNYYLRNDPDNGYYSRDAIGIKTGFHSEAMNCFVGAARRNYVEFVSVVFYTSDRGRWYDTQRLMDYGFTQYVSTDPIALYAANPRVLNISGFDLSDKANLGRLELGIRVSPDYAERDVHVVGALAEIEALKNDFGKLSHVNWIRPDRAPVTEGETMGILTFYPNGQETVEYELYATRSIEARKDAPPSLADIEASTLADPNPFPRFSWEYVTWAGVSLALFLLLLRALYRRASSKRARKKRLPMPKHRYYR
ncbi:MAG: D-alanyl-D-alanine carboxypeptidase [Oscillospiraceae bacterium]|jgi:D-alanyl-D-alanine carboxypeptidase (penicillin-binding protein 5/6)|nr:D-alanyl-D-alanine carboxypeptidase [Oscillospiraceae bacterium]